MPYINIGLLHFNMVHIRICVIFLNTYRLFDVLLINVDIFSEESIINVSFSTFPLD